MIRHLMIVALPVVLLAGTATASPEGDLLQSMGRCAGVHAESARLKCYDALAPELRSVLAAQGTASPPPLATNPEAPAPSSGPTAQAADTAATPNATAASAAPPGPPTETFGLSRLPGRREPQTTAGDFGQETVARTEPEARAKAPKQINKIAASITDYATTPQGSLIVFLDNGQVWRQLDSAGPHPHLKRGTNENTVVISRGIFGSYSMVINNKGRLIKVIRVK